VPLGRPGRVEVGQVFQVILEFVSGAGPPHEIECRPQPHGELAFGRSVFVEHLDELLGILRRLPAVGDLSENIGVESIVLRENVGKLDDQRRDADAKHHHLDVFNPVSREIADHQRVGHHAGVDQREEPEGRR